MGRMRSLILVGGLLCSQVSYGDIFKITDLNSFEHCMSQDHLVETSKAGNTKQTQFVDKLTIQVRCLEKAEVFLAKEKSAATIKKWVNVSFKYSHHDNAIGLLKLLAQRDRKECNEPAIYDTLMNIFSTPHRDDPKSLFQRARGVAKICLADKQFKQDFTDEQDSSEGSYRKANVCEILKAEKMVKACKP